MWPRSSAKCLLAFMEPRRFEAYLRKHHPDPAEAEIIRKEIETVRETRVGVNYGGAGGTHIGIASPVLAGDSQVTVAVAMAGPRPRMEEHLEDMLQSLRETTEILSRGGTAS